MTLAAEPASASADELIAPALDIIRRVMEKPALEADDDVADHGATSLVIVRLLSESGRHFGLTISPRSLGGVVSARRIAEIVAAATPANRTGA